ncbi:MAG: DNA repair protein RecN [Bacteroidales bacterium]|nr:DNA repair protein RecN [Bacteroidales bacterium]HPD96028.1 DNA repair protein RecN [Tenuifilaceae bacterium]HRX31677.1 DNA repair protein RecN [Tenuifilaceae bacterium]
MLRKLHIQNFALIDELDIDFQPGLNIITGETGAGKSILLGALMLILGQRADSSSLMNPDKPCVVEGEFDVSTYDLSEFFEQNDIDYNTVTTIRRNISANGKSRAFINEIPVNLSLLKDLGDLLIDIHSQHQNLLLGNSQFQLKVLDAFASSKSIMEEYRLQYKKYKSICADYEKLKLEAETASKDFEYMQHQLNELQSASIKAGELDELENLQRQLTHATEIKMALETAYGAINADDISALHFTKEAISSLKRISEVFSATENVLNRLDSCRIELKDIADELDAQNAKIFVDDGQLSNVTARIDLLFGLLQKHRAASVEDLIAYRDELARKVEFIGNVDFNLQELHKTLLEEKTKVNGLADKLSSVRKKAVLPIEKSITEMLVQLGIKHAVFKIDIDKIDDFQEWGTDKVTFLFSANDSVKPMELAKVASGGELSRLMLSLKSLLVKSTGLPTVIFDEIDTGVSGEIAYRMGSIIQQMAKGMQVINITHLPQIAAKGSTHFLVYKQNTDKGSKTGIKRLTSDERIIEIAKMLSGEKVTDAALQNAKELLG